MKVYVARQPVFKKNKKLYGYELLFRGGMSNAFPDIDGDTATSKLLSNSFFNIGIDQLTGGKMAFINFTQELLVRKIPMMFPIENMMVEILEDVNPNKELVNACLDIFRAGYAIALDDFVFKDELKPLIKLAQIIKIDFMLSPIEEIKRLVNMLKGSKIKLL
ncbi:MAG: signal transduction protein, partial [Desulfobacterales bacterium]